jgi:hypothetical protein
MEAIAGKERSIMAANALRLLTDKQFQPGFLIRRQNHFGLFGIAL